MIEKQKTDEECSQESSGFKTKLVPLICPSTPLRYFDISISKVNCVLQNYFAFFSTKNDLEPLTNDGIQCSDQRKMRSCRIRARFHCPEPEWP